MTQRLNTNFAVRQTENEATSSTERHGFGKGHVRELEGGRDLRSARVAAVPLDGLAGRARGRLPRALPAARHDEWLPRPSPILGTRARPTPALRRPRAATPISSPKTADTITFGAVFSFDKFRFSADWFEIDLGDAITQSPGNQPLVNACFKSGGTGPACDRVDGRGDSRHHRHRFQRDQLGRVPDERLGLRGDLRLPDALGRQPELAVHRNVSLRHDRRHGPRRGADRLSRPERSRSPRSARSTRSRSGKRRAFVT